MQAMAASESLNALFIGGLTQSNSFKVPTGNKAGIFRLDLARNTWAWRKVFTCAGCQLDVVTAVAVS